MKIPKIILGVFFLVIMSILVYATDITNCTNIKDSGSYELIVDILDSTSTRCINITIGNVYVNCGGHLIDSSFYSNGVYINAVSNITLENCVFTNWSNAIYALKASNVTIRNTSLIDSNDYGFVLYSSGNTTILDSVYVTNAGDTGILLNVGVGHRIINSRLEKCTNFIVDSGETTNGIEIYNNTFYSDTDSYHIYFNGDGHNIHGNIFEYGALYVAASSTNNKVYNNLFNNTKFTILDGSNTTWNSTLAEGINIVTRDLTNISGNYWANATGGGYSEVCSDSPFDGFCDSPLNVSTLVSCEIGSTCGIDVDYMPLSKQPVPVLSLKKFQIKSIHLTIKNKWFMVKMVI